MHYARAQRTAAVAVFHILQTLCAIEAQLENLLGSFHCSMTGLCCNLHVTGS